MTVPNPKPRHDRINDHPATDVEHDDDGCTTCNAGKLPGYARGFVDGYSEGRKAGYADGFRAGDADGFCEGFAACAEAYRRQH